MVTLLKLREGGCSLEFAAEDIDRVRAALTARYGVPVVKKYPVLTVYAFGPTELAFQNEWDDPCLIANTPDGETMLRDIAADLGAHLSE